MKFVSFLWCAGAALLLAGCGHSTAQIPAVAPFELPRYLGTWHEAARMPHWFERGMSQVTAEYFFDSAGRLRVRNRGIKDGKLKEIEGFVRQKTPDTGELEVTFFRPFYSSYRVIALKPDYSAALVTAGTKEYAWILVRDPKLAETVVPEYRNLLLRRGFDCSKLEVFK